jgi:hypothetical protein
MGATVSKDKQDEQHPQRQRQKQKSKPKAKLKNNKVVEQGGNDNSKVNSDNESHEQQSNKHPSQGDSAGMPRRGMEGSRKETSGFHQDGGSSFITDDEVKVNLAMADLMAFLLVVANNSNNLPLTRRDDPDVGKTVSTLTSDEYARKSAAFVPADVRVIGGSFLKYGRVWDLPTSEEYTANDGAQEPGMFLD